MENETFWIHRLYAAALWHFLYRQHALSAALALLQWNFVSHQRLCPNCLQLMCHWKAKYGFIKSFPPDLFQTQKRTILSANAPHQTMRLLFGSGVMLRYTLGNTASRSRSFLRVCSAVTAKSSNSVQHFTHCDFLLVFIQVSLLLSAYHTFLHLKSTHFFVR